MKIGIFGGTFNPIHNGHIEMIKMVKEKNELDQVFIVPSYQTPDKEFQIEKITPKDRFTMVKNTVKQLNLPWLKVSDFEYTQKSISYTYKTIEYFKQKYSTADLFWIMGEDRFKGFDKWENYDVIKDNTEIIIFRRNEEINMELVNNEEITFMQDVYFDISSTQVLNELRWDFIPAAAKDYIQKNKLYLRTIVFNVLGAARYEHSVAVGSHAKRLSERYKYKDVQKAQTVGLLHDLFKLHDENFLLNYKQNKGAELTDKVMPTGALHGVVAALWLRDEYGWKDKEVFDAIASHTLTRANTTKLDKIIYVADKISTDRKGHKTGKLRKLAYLDLDQTYKKIIKQSVKKLNERGIPIHEDTYAAYREHIDPKFGLNKHDFDLKENKTK